MASIKNLTEIFTWSDKHSSTQLKDWEQFLGYCHLYAEQGGISEKIKIDNEKIKLSWEPSLWSKEAPVNTKHIEPELFFTGAIHDLGIKVTDQKETEKIDLCDDILKTFQLKTFPQSQPEKFEILSECFNNRNTKAAHFHIFQAHGSPGEVSCENFDQLSKELKNRVIWINSCCEYENEDSFIKGASNFFLQKEPPLFCRTFYNNGCSIACSRFRIPLWYLPFQNTILLETLNEKSGGFWFEDVFLTVIKKIHRLIFPQSKEELFKKAELIRQQKGTAPLIEDFFVHLGWLWYGRQNRTIPMIAIPIKEKIEIFSTDNKTPQIGRIFLGTKEKPEWLDGQKTIQQMKLSCILTKEGTKKIFLLSLLNWVTSNFNLTSIEKIISIKNKITSHSNSCLYILLYMIETHWNKNSIIDIWAKELIEQFKKEGIVNVFFRRIFPNTKELRCIEENDRIYIKKGHYDRVLPVKYFFLV